MADERISIAGIIDAYVLLRENESLELLPGANLYELDVQHVLKFLQGYNHKISRFDFARFDFMDGHSDDPRYAVLFPDNEFRREVSPVKSFNIIRQISSEPDRYTSEIYVDSNNNYCWRRFSVVKEACHVLFLSESDKIGINYPNTSTFDSVFRLIQTINTLPFSIYDFEDEKYSATLGIENAAEVLAFLLLCSHERLIDERKIAAERYKTDPFLVDYYAIADRYKVPRRYMELFLTEDTIGVLLDKIAERMHSPFEVVPPPPRPGPVIAPPPNPPSSPPAKPDVKKN